MASLSEAWMMEYNEALKLADKINHMVSNASSLPSNGPQTQRHFSATRRKITILKTKMESLDSDVSQLSGSKPPITEKETKKRKEMLENVRSRVDQMANTLNSYSNATRDHLLGHDSKSDEIMKKVADMDNQGLVGFQRQVMKEQDEGLAKLEETVISTKHIAMAVNEELNLQTRLLDTLDEHVESTSSRLQRVQRNLAALSRRTRGGGACLCLVSLLIVMLVLIIVALIKYL